MTHLELLAPAKNLECGKAAIDHGADAVYIGAKRFGARASAGNSTEDIDQLCRYAHQFGAKVFVTVNTIIYDEELEDTLDLVKELDNIGVDAILVQDMGLYSRLKAVPLRCHLHASTQTDNRSKEKVEWLASLGFQRVVLARELSIDEIRDIHEALPETELEVFVHGALCVSYSGQCYASQYCFNRSANRGECAQFCRLPFTLKDADGRILEEDKYLLSLKDMAQIDNIERLVKAGAVSFKIEGRLKDVDYVKNVTAAYSNALNQIVARYPNEYARASFGKCSYSFTPDIRKSFNRGFTTYFADGRSNQSMITFFTPKARGEYVGKVKEIRGHSFNVAGTAAFANGDGLCFIDSEGQLVGFRVNKVEGNRIFPLRMPQTLRPGTQLYRNLDQSFTTALAKPTSERKIDIAFRLAAEGNTLILSASDEMGRHAEVKTVCELQKAQKPQYDNIVRQLTKLGGTIFFSDKVEVDTDAFIPSSVLANMRRDVVDAIISAPIYINKVENSGKNAANDHLKADVSEPGKPEIAGKKPSVYPIPYLYNASNDAAKAFYKHNGVGEATSFEMDAHHGNVLMQCRYCLRNEMGYCTKTGKKAPWKEPLTISMTDGREFQLQFDCRHCQMNVLRNA